jgi:hypothetical protein
MSGAVTAIGNLFGASSETMNTLGTVGSLADTAMKIAPLAGMFMGGGGGGTNTTTSVTTPSLQYPTPSYIAGKRSQGTANAGQSRNNAYESMARNLSIRGIGPNSPYASGKASGIEGSYLDSLTGLENKLLDLENTPTNIGSTTVSESPKSTSNPLAMALGMMMYGNGRNSGATTGQQKNWWEM